MVIHMCEDFINSDIYLESDVEVNKALILQPLLTAISNIIEVSQISQDFCGLQTNLGYLITNRELHRALIKLSNNPKLCLYLLSNLIVYVQASQDKALYSDYLSSLT